MRLHPHRPLPALTSAEAPIENTPQVAAQTPRIGSEEMGNAEFSRIRGK